MFVFSLSGLFCLNPLSAEFLKFTSYCCLKPLWSGMGEVYIASLYLAAPTPILSHCASNVATSTLTADMISGCQNMGITFIGGEMEHFCRIPRLQNYSYDQQKYIGIPENGNQVGLV